MSDQQPTWLPPTPVDALRARAAFQRARVEAIPEPLREDFDRLGLEMQGFDDEIAALQAQRGAVYDEWARILEIAVAEADSDTALLALRHSADGWPRLMERVRALHPRFMDITEWTPDWPTEVPVLPSIGLHVALTGYGDPLQNEDPAVLAEAITLFATRFVHDVPQYGTFAGKIPVEVQTRNTYGQRYIWFAPGGSEAVLCDRNRVEAEGTLGEVVEQALRAAIRDQRDAEYEAEHGDDY